MATKGQASNGNVTFDEKNGSVIISVNPAIYPLDVIYPAAYVFMDRAYIMIDGDPKDEIFVEMVSKEGCSLVELAGDFNNELLNYAVYKKQVERNGPIREALITRALLSNGVQLVPEPLPQAADAPKDAKGAVRL